MLSSTTGQNSWFDTWLPLKQRFPVYKNENAYLVDVGILFERMTKEGFAETRALYDRLRELHRTHNRTSAALLELEECLSDVTEQLTQSSRSDTYDTVVKMVAML